MATDNRNKVSQKFLQHIMKCGR